MKKYFVIEALYILGSTLVFLICFWKFGLTYKALAAMVFMGFALVLIVIDLRHMLLPDIFTLSCLWIGLLLNLSGQNGLWAPLQSAVLGAVLGYGLLFLIYWIFKFFTGKEGLGFGDFKLMAALGAWFGAGELPLILLLSSIFGLIFAGFFYFYFNLKNKNKSAEFPFGPALLLAGIVCLFLN